MAPRGMISDEEYARQLQEEYDREAAGVAPSYSTGDLPVAVPILSSSPNNIRNDNVYTTSSQPPPPAVNPYYNNNNSNSTTTTTTTQILPSSALQSATEILDEEYAKRLERQMQDEDLARRLQQQEHHTNSTTSSTTTTTILLDYNDEQLAQQLQMEEQRLARQQPLQTLSQQQQQQPSPPRQPKSCRNQLGTILCYSLFVGIVVVAIVVIFSLVSGKQVPIGNINNPFDPYKGNGGLFPTSKWQSNQNGLYLTVYNALSSDWYTYFDQGIYNWAYGHSPTSLQLTTIVIAADSACSSISGAVKVCNGNYGDTGWKGINEAMVTSSGFITESTAKMNDYYLQGSTAGEKQYTMCHETGHAWGLNHQDEDFYNKDLGTCMDYVMDPQNNQNPDLVDFDILFKLYGYIPNATRTRDLEEEEEHIWNPSKPQFTSITDSITKTNNRKWRLLKRTSRHEIHELDLGSGYRMISRVMLADPTATTNNNLRKSSFPLDDFIEY